MKTLAELVGLHRQLRTEAFDKLGATIENVLLKNAEEINDGKRGNDQRDNRPTAGSDAE